MTALAIDWPLTISLASLLVSIVVAVCALYLSYLALQHTAKPRGEVTIIDRMPLRAGEDFVLRFAFGNKGHWYARPPILEMEAWLNFDPAFDIHQVKFGSRAERCNREARTGKHGRRYLKIWGLKIAYGEGREPAIVSGIAPTVTGKYLCSITAISENGLALTKSFILTVI